MQPEAIQYELRAAGMQIRKGIWSEEEQNMIPMRLTFVELEAIATHMQGYALDLLLLRPVEIMMKGIGPPTFGVSPPSSPFSPPTGWQGGPAGSSAATRGRGGLTRGRGRGRGRGGKQNDGWVKDLTREGIEPNPGPSSTEKAAATTAHPPSQAEENFEGQEREEMNDFPSSAPSDSDEAESEIFAYHAAEVQTRLPHRQPRRSKPRPRRRRNPDREGARHRRRQL
uniref:Uncharacterized protein n=1 Tax=Chromera velia CCMP2878 TaxID=1169474 RepID=A0A0G4HH13_9ALVE|eukprot:Cvel_27477.t1-p1 / transcript=Cvel_27477.t1 / gene=Cvel_27477 / organism=Chromera_velia_CCMP2878 / gene_product=hypothetical protein / transcript_product=hypothetical protein / location=Cvel_scaffold3433:14242-15666(+) / protein_length=225 / sequence_SO=supercontig / SO=protein_coding / is_pseudo=false